MNPPETDPQYIARVNKDYYPPKKITDLMDPDFFNTIRTSSESTWKDDDQKIDAAVQELQKKLTKINPDAKIIRYISQNDVAISDTGVKTGKGRILISLPQTPGDPISRYIQLVVPEKNSLDINTGQMSVISIDHKKKPAETVFADYWRSYDSQTGKFTSFSPRSTQALAGNCLQCHISGALAIHPGAIDEKTYGKSLAEMNAKISHSDSMWNAIKNPDMPGAGEIGPTDKLLDQCVPAANFSGDEARLTSVRKAVSANMDSCVNCHNVEYGPRAPLSFQSLLPHGTLGGNRQSMVAYRIGSVMDSTDPNGNPKAKPNHAAHRMPPGSLLSEEEASYLTKCITTAYLGFKGNTPGEDIHSPLIDWLTFKTSDDSTLRSCFYQQKSGCMNAALGKTGETVQNTNDALSHK